MVTTKREIQTKEDSRTTSTPSPEVVFRAIMLASKKMPHFFDKVLEEVDLRLTEFRVLQRLSEMGPTPMAKLSDETLVTKAAVTAITDEMEQKGLVKRVREPTDRRIIKVEMTPAGSRLYALAKQRHEAIIARIISLLDPDEIKVLLRSYEKLNKFIDQESV